MCGHIIMRDRIRNKYILDKVEVTPVMDKLREAILKWCRHVKRRCKDDLVRRCERLGMASMRGKVELAVNRKNI